jgi:hypothetical protein
MPLLGASCTWAAWRTSSCDQDQVESPIVRDLLDPDKDKVVSRLNNLGDDGWELCSVSSYVGRPSSGPLDVYMFFKRAKR